MCSSDLMQYCFACHMFMHFPYTRTFFSLYVILLLLLGTFLIVFFFSLPLFLFMLVTSMAPKRKSTSARNPLYSSSSSSSDPSPSNVRFSDDDAFKAFSENFSRRGIHLDGKSFCRTLPTPTFALSFTVGDGSHYVTSWSPVLLCLSRSFTPTYTGLIV